MSYRDDWKKEIDEHASIRTLHESLRDEIRRRWNRSLPFSEELFDRWERARYLGFGTEASIYDSSVVIGDVAVGEHTWIGPFTVLDGSGGLSIGSYCSISAGVQIYSHDTVAWALTGGKAKAVRRSVAIGNRTYIGPLAVIAAGVQIGSQCVIGSGALVTSNIPDNSVAHGTPARVVGHVDVGGDEARIAYNPREQG